MWEKIRVIFTIPELRQKILLTLMLLAIYRVGWQIPLPIVDHHKMTAFFKEGQGGLGDLLNQVAVFSASQLNQATIFGLGIILGAIWAEAAWGRFWGWDPKETVSFITWVLYAGYLHARATAGWRNTNAAWINILALVTMIFNLFFINMVV